MIIAALPLGIALLEALDALQSHPNVTLENEWFGVREPLPSAVFYFISVWFSFLLAVTSHYGLAFLPLPSFGRTVMIIGFSFVCAFIVLCSAFYVFVAAAFAADYLGARYYVAVVLCFLTGVTVIIHSVFLVYYSRRLVG